MIYLLLLLDILINNFTNYTSYFFIIYLYNKKFKFYLLVGLILDLIILDTYFFTTIVLSLIFIINKLFNDLNKNNFYVYVFINLFNYILFIIFNNIIFFGSFSKILMSIGSGLFINILFYVLTYKTCKN